MNSFPYSLYLIVDPDLCFCNPVTIAKTGIMNGVDIIQLRYKGEDISMFHDLARQFRQLTEKHRIPFIVNDRVDICMSVDADGVHLGQNDFPVMAARKMLGKKKIIGLSTHNMQQALEAHKEPVDYIGLGPVFATSSKKKADPAVGLNKLRTILQQTNLPCFAIGGISPGNIGEIVSAGAKRIAMITAVTHAKDPAMVTKQLRNALKHGHNT